MTCFSFFLELLKAVLLKKDKTNDSTPPPQHSLQPPTSYSGAVASHTPTSKPSYSAAASHSTPASGPSSHDDAPPTSTYSKPLPGPASGVEKALEEIWNLDENRFIPGKDFTLDLQSYTFVSHMEDKSFRPLFGRGFDTSMFQSRPTFRLFLALLDNYKPEVTANEIREQEAFLDEIMKTAPIRYLHAFLVSKQRDLLKLWFTGYKRVVHNDSSSFEHAFVGELRDGKVSGFHNWCMLALEEKKGNVNYHGYIKPKGKSKVNESILSLQLSWFDKVKNVSTFLMGVSPECEVALYTLCFYMKHESYRARLGGKQVSIKMHTFHGSKIGSCYVDSR